MSYTIEFTKKAKKDIKLLEKAGNNSILNKLDNLLRELESHPKTGTGKPEFLKYEKYWSRRIDTEHRLCYEIYDNIVVVLVL